MRLFLGAALFAALLIFLLYSYRTCFYVPKKRHEDIYAAPQGEQYEKYAQKMVEIALIMDEAPAESVSIQSRDGLTLWGRYYEYYPGAPLILAFHGYRSMCVRDNAGAFALAQKLGFNILAVDQRAHGKSEGSCISFGIKERYDCQSWVDYAARRFGADLPIVLCGISMGAATVLMASDLELPGNVVGIMADCPYSSPAAIIRKVAKELGYPEKLAWPVIYLGARLFGGADMNESTATASVEHTSLPILLIHGEDDRFVPCHMSREIYAHCHSPAQLHTFPEAGHGLCYILDPKRYEKICVEFLYGLPGLKEPMDKSDFVKKTLQ